MYVSQVNKINYNTVCLDTHYIPIGTPILSRGLRLTVLDSPGTVLYFVPSTNKVAGIVRLIILYHHITGFGLVQRTYGLI